MYETVARGELVLFDLYNGNGLAGHSVLLTGAYDDMAGNHVLVAYDSNCGSAYAEGMAYTRFIIEPDYSAIGSEEYDVVAFDWLSDFSGFDAFRRDGSGDPMSWYRSLIAHLKDLIEMIRAFFSSVSDR